MASIRPGPNGHQGGPPPPPPQQYGPHAPSQQRSNGYPINSMPPNAPPPGAASPNYPSAATLKQLSDANVATWMDLGRLAESMDDNERAKIAYEMAIKNNHDSIPAKKAIALLYKDKLKILDKAIEFLQSCLQQNDQQGDILALLGHCYLMTGELPRAYQAYQQGLGSMSNAQDPDVWYGIGLLYDRYASFDHAEEAFSNVLYIEPNHRKRNEIYFRLGIIYKQQKKLQQSIACFEYILNSPPEPLTPANIYTQIGYVYEISSDYVKARDAFEVVLQEEPESTKVLLQLGFIHSIPHTRIRDLDRAQYYIDRALNIEPKDAQAWYYLGRYYMQRLNYSKAYEAYQQAVYRDSRNSNFWCSIGVLYWEINQFRDALDAYTRAIRLNPYIPEIWFNLGTLYEACNNQIQDAIDAYNRAYELDNSYYQVEERLSILKRNMETGRNEGPPPPRPSDIDPQRYEDFLQNQANQQSHAQLTAAVNTWAGTNAPGGPPPASQHRGHPSHQPMVPPHSQYPPRRSPDQLKTAPYSHPPPAPYSNGSSGYGRPPPAPPVSIKRGTSPGPSPYGYDARPQMNEPPHQGYPRHEEMSQMSHRPPHLPPTQQNYISPRQHERELGPGGIGGSAPFPPPASRSPVSYSNRSRSPPPGPTPISQHGPPPDVKPVLDQGPPVSPTNSHNIQLAPLQSIRSPHQVTIPPVPRNDAAAYPPPNEPSPAAPKRREWESERDYGRNPSSRSSPHSHNRVDPVHEERRTSGEQRPEERRPSPQQKPHDPTPPRIRSPLISPRTAEPSYAPASERHSPQGAQKMDVDSPDKLERSTSREDPDKMQIEEDKRPEVEAPARVMEVDEDYDKEEEKPEK